MRKEIADLVYPALSHGLRLKERLDRGEAADFYTEQSHLKRLLRSDSEARRWADYGVEGAVDVTHLGAGRGGESMRRPAMNFLGIRYALACWLDELFILDSPWGQQWDNQSLEMALYNTRQRATDFWEQARKAETRNDALEAYFLCVVLGFRGRMRDSPQELAEWFTAAQARIVGSQPKEWPEPPRLDFAMDVDPRRGRDRFQTMLLAAAGWALVVIGLISFWAITQFQR